MTYFVTTGDSKGTEISPSKRGYGYCFNN
jgi:hypothetical protein